jgi:uncharacterized protein (UPF0332 family)/predicted nucleotidyltransferase
MTESVIPIATQAKHLATALPSSLSESERRLLAELLDRLGHENGAGIEHVILYGSKARGESWEGSDIDVLIVSTLGLKRLLDLTTELETDEPALLLMPLGMSPDEFSRYQRLRMPLYVNLCRDGIELWDDTGWAEERASVIADFSNEGEARKMTPETKETIRVYMEDAHRSLEVMRIIERENYLDYAVSRGFYAAFNALSAALYAVNIVRGSHSAVKAALSTYLVQPGLIEKEYPKIYEKLMEAREWGDYRKPDVTYTDDQLRQMLDDADRFVARMETFLKEKGYID